MKQSFGGVVMLEGETRHEQRSNQTDILKEDRPEFGSRLDREA